MTGFTSDKQKRFYISQLKSPKRIKVINCRYCDMPQNVIKHGYVCKHCGGGLNES